MLTTDEKVKLMSIFGKVELRYISKPDHFCVWLPVKLRPISDTSWLIELDAVINDIYGNSVEEAIDKMFNTLTKESYIVEAYSKGRFKFINGSFINVNDISPSNWEAKSSVNKEEPKNDQSSKESSKLNPFIKTALGIVGNTLLSAYEKSKEKQSDNIMNVEKVNKTNTNTNTNTVNHKSSHNYGPNYIDYDIDDDYYQYMRDLEASEAWEEDERRYWERVKNGEE